MQHYSVTSVIWLSLEDYYNAGLTPEQVKTTIELMDYPAGGCLKLKCEQQFINNNWNVHTGLTDREQIHWLTRNIYHSLDMALKYGAPVLEE